MIDAEIRKLEVSLKPKILDISDNKGREIGKENEISCRKKIKIVWLKLNSRFLNAVPVFLPMKILASRRKTRYIIFESPILLWLQGNLRLN